MIALEDAIAITRASARVLPAEEVALHDALGRVLARAVHSPMDLPPFDNSAMDGFALRTPNGLADGDEFDVTGEQAAGDGARPAGAGAWEIMTGARVPDGFDAVIPVEEVCVLARDAAGRPTRIRLESGVRCGQHVRRRGQDIAQGELAVQAGLLLGPAEVMLLGGIGVAAVSVRKRPRVALLCTGRELVDAPEAILATGHIYNTNGPYLAARLMLAGADVVLRATVPDQAEAFVHVVGEALALGVDAIISTGAVSMGRYDFVPEALRTLGGEVLFHKVRMRPGKPLLLARLPCGTLCFGLPGNPVSSAVGERFFVEAALRVMLGMPAEAPWRLPLLAEAPKKPGFAMFQKARLEIAADGGVGVRLLQGQESFRTRPLLESRAWALLPADAELVAAGTLIDVHPLGHTEAPLLRGFSA